MSIVQHLNELRDRVIQILLAVVVGTIVGFIWYQTAVPGFSFTIPKVGTVQWGGIPALGEILRGPYCSLDPDKRVSLTADGECRLLATTPMDMFMLRLKVGALAGVVLSSPWWLYQIWAFITPGLKRNERKHTLTFVSAAVTLFVLGAVLAYFVVSFGLEFLLTMGQDFQAAALSGTSYFNFLITLIVVFGVSFELPLIIIMLNRVGVLKYEQMKEKRHLIIIGLFIFAAFMTPGGDPMSMVALASTMVLLAEIAIQISRIHDRKLVEKRPEWLDLDDETASSLDLSAGGVDAPQGLGSPSDVGAPTGLDTPSDLGSPSQLGGVSPVSAPTSVRETRRNDGVSRPRTQPFGGDYAEDLGDFSARDTGSFDDVL
nr:twin-arginine translocase subunit TatC [Corynebacterium ulceribovis]